MKGFYCIAILIIAMGLGGCVNQQNVVLKKDDQMNKVDSVEKYELKVNANNKEIACRLNINSEVKDVSLFINGKYLWDSKKETKEFILQNCEETKITLKKTCYPNKDITVNFEDNTLQEINIPRSDWEKYAYIRFDYNEGYNKKVTIKGFTKNPFNLYKSHHITKKVPLNLYNYKILSDYKLDFDNSLKVCSENSIKILEVVTNNPENTISSLQGELKNINHSIGKITFLTEKNDATLRIVRTRKLNEEIVDKSNMTRFNNQISILVPNSIELATGSYMIRFGSKKKTIKLLPNKNQIVDLDKI